jgi:hypothetical protein
VVTIVFKDFHYAKTKQERRIRKKERKGKNRIP